MGLLDRLFGKSGKPASAPRGAADEVNRQVQFPATFPLANGELQVKVFTATVNASNGTLPLVCYVTDGLSKQGQAEMLLCVYEAQLSVREDCLNFMSQLFHLASQGRRVSSGDITKFSGPGLLGFGGVLYLETPVLDGIAVPPGCLNMVLLRPDEVEALQIVGHLRIASMLGNQAGFFPYPHWVDVNRPVLPLKQMIESTVLRRVSGCFRFAGSRLVMQGDTCTLERASGRPFAYPSEMAFPPAQVLAILPGLDHKADACLTWPTSNSPEAISAPGSVGERISMCFLIIAGPLDQEEFSIVEDGFILMLNEQHYGQFWEALRSSTDWDCRSPAGKVFQLRSAGST